jgi:DNA-binding GntR family transcriptional regulator
MCGLANQGAIVSGYDRERMLNLVQNKSVLEAYATRLSIDFLTPEAIAELREINERFRVAYENNYVRAYSRENEAFHMKIYECIPNKDLLRLIKSMWKMWVINKSVFSIILASASLSVQEHEQILRMIEEKKYDTIEGLVRHHKLRSGIELVNYITAWEETK